MNLANLPPVGMGLYEMLQRHPGLHLQIGDYVFDIEMRRVTNRPGVTRIGFRAIAVLLELARHPNITMTKRQLLKKVWGKNAPRSADVLIIAIGELRRLFLDDAKIPRYIETVPRIGYRLLAPAHLLQSATAPYSNPANPENQTLAFPVLADVADDLSRVRNDGELHALGHR